MARPALRTGTRNGQFRMAIPRDIQRILAKLPEAYRPRGWGKEEITITLGTSDRRKMAAEHSRINAEVQERFTKLKAGKQTLSQKEAVALAGEVYAAFADGAEDDPGPAGVWRNALAANEAARRGRYGKASLKIGDAGQVRTWSMEERFGPIADMVLAAKCLIVDGEGRTKLIEALAGALDDASQKLKRNAEGDYSPDPAAKRFPKWEGGGPTRGGGRAGKRVTLRALFDQWAKHPEQREQSPATVNRYRGVFDAAVTFLGDPDARDISPADIQRYIEGRMADEREPLKPRTARDVHKAALSAVFGWAESKGIVASNSAIGVKIKVRRAVQTRPKDASNDEARKIADAAMGIAPETAIAGTLESARKWCPLICLYTGCRIGEVTQLRREDVIEVEGVPVLHITPAAGTVKTGEYRYVPLHPKLIQLGFLAFVATAPASGPLFLNPDTRRNRDAATPQSQLIASKVGQWARANGLDDPRLLKPLHALRHRFMTCARRAGIEEQYIEQIAGHAPGRMNRRYGDFPVDVLYREICKLEPSQVEGRR
jgi:integrase